MMATVEVFHSSTYKSSEEEKLEIFLFEYEIQSDLLLE